MAVSSGAVEILMSTFNGARHLPALLDSLWAQDYPNVTLTARDDGSTDNTTEVLQLHFDHHDARLTMGQNLGPARSFLSLLERANSSASYVAFCDQDDVWLPHKLSSAVRALAGLRGPALYCSTVELVGPDLSHIRMHNRCVRGPSFENALVENIATGCTIVLNRDAVDLVTSHLPEHCIMHDAWCYLVLAAFGQIIYDVRPGVRYRLHGENAIGVGSNRVQEWVGRVRRWRAVGGQGQITRQAKEFRRVFGDSLPASAALSLDQFLDSQQTLIRRLSYAVKGGAYFQRRLDDLLFRALYAAHRV